jgi:septal ring factor EnvC (AmiA/AmiB activator)
LSGLRGGLAAAVLLAAAGGAAAGPSQQEELRALRDRIETIRKALAEAEGAQAGAADALRASETAISEANRSLRELAAERDRLREELGRVAREAGRVRGALDRQQAELAAALRARYVNRDTGGAGALRLVLSGEDPQRIARALVYHARLVQAQADLIARARVDLDRLRSLESSAREKASEIAGIETQARSERDALLVQATERRVVLARHADQIRDQRRDLERAERNEARLARLVEALARVQPEPAPRRPPEGPPARAADAPAVGEFGGLKGRLPMPVRGELAGRFGTPQEAGPGPSNKGIFVRAPGGSEVRAVAAGRVVFADWMRGYGNLLILDHGEGYLTIYGNNESVLKRVGDAVHGGETVATVGASGGNEASGLYFEVRFQGRPFDPLPWLQSSR